MIDGMLLYTGVTVYSPWFPRQADMLRVAAECIAASGVSLTIRLYTKNEEDAGDGNAVDADESILLTTTGDLEVQEWNTQPTEQGVKQLLRFRYEATSGEGNNHWMLFRLLPPVWFDAVQA